MSGRWRIQLAAPELFEELDRLASESPPASDPEFPLVLSAGVSLNELTAPADRDWLAGTPWHKHTPARIEAL